jgi:hypothetical protein
MTMYKTAVFYVGPSRVAIVGNKWVVEHWCKTCHHQVPADQLVDHAKGHLPDELAARAEVLDPALALDPSSPTSPKETSATTEHASN